jgi:hypothetical protein
MPNKIFVPKQLCLGLMLPKLFSYSVEYDFQSLQNINLHALFLSKAAFNSNKHKIKPNHGSI